MLALFAVHIVAMILGRAFASAFAFATARSLFNARLASPHGDFLNA